MALAVALALAVSLALAVVVPVALGLALALGLGVAVGLGLALLLILASEIHQKCPTDYPKLVFVVLLGKSWGDHFCMSFFFSSLLSRFCLPFGGCWEC